MTSTVLDVGLCLLLVSASVGVLVTTAEDPQSESVGSATVVATTTATIEYTIEPVRSNGSTATPYSVREHGTIAELLALATIETATIHGTPLSPSAAALESAVRNVTRERLGARTQVIGIWEPYRGASIRGRVVVGQNPPSGATVQTGVISIPSGIDPVKGSLGRDEQSSFDDLAGELATSLRSGLDPNAGYDLTQPGPHDGRSAYRDGRDDRLTEAIEEHNVSTGNPGGETAAERVDATRSTQDPLTRWIEADLRESADEPTEAAEDVDLGTVRIIIRTW